MSDNHISISGKILHVFAHRFVVETKQGVVLADVAPHGLEHVALHVGAAISLEGKVKPSEIKVSRLTLNGRTVTIEHGKPRDRRRHHEHHDHVHEPADPTPALQAARAAGYEPAAVPRRKARHFEVLGKHGSDFSELHIELDGHIRKIKPAGIDDPKWQKLAR